MASVTGIATTFGLPNYHGELIALSPTETPLLSAAGGVSGGGAVTDTTIEWQAYDLRAAAIRTRLEGADAPTAEARVRANVTNRVQIFQEAVSTSYTKQAAIGQYRVGAAGDAPGGAANPVTDEHSWQVMQALKQIARDVNYSFWNGARVDPADNTTARQMAGLLSVMTSNVQGAAVTAAASAATDTITATVALAVNDKVVFTDVGASTTIFAARFYWVVQVTGTASFKVSATKAGTPITVGTATVSFYQIPAAGILTVDNLNLLLQSVFDNGGIAEGGTATLFVPSGQKRQLTKAYQVSGIGANLLGGTRNLGGLSVDSIITDFGTLNVAIDRALPSDCVTVVSVEQIKPVFLAIPGKGVLFEESLAKTGSADKVQIYGEIGMQYGNQAAHGIIRGLFA